MTTVRVTRQPRRTAPDLSAGLIEISAPPRMAESMPMTGSVGMILVPAASGVGAVLLAVTQQNRPLLATAGLLVLAASIIVGLVMMVGSRTGDRRRTREQRERYLDYLERVRRQTREAAHQQSLDSRLCHPPPDEVAGAAGDSTRCWERRTTDPDFLLLRVGIGRAALGQALGLGFAPDDPQVSYDPVCLWAATTLVAQYTELPGQPICLPLPATAAVAIQGDDPGRVHAVARALLAQASWAHRPDDVAILLVSSRAPAWDWLKWLPHHHSHVNSDGSVPARLFAESAALATGMLLTEADSGTIVSGRPARRFIVVIDLIGGDPATADALTVLQAAAATAAAAMVYLQVGEPSADSGFPAGPVDTRLLVAAGGPDTVEQVIGGRVVRTPCSLDRMDLAGAQLLAKSFAPFRPADEGRPLDKHDGRTDLVRSVDITALDPAVSWRPRSVAAHLRVPIGVGDDGALVEVDLKESAAGGMGPHGLVVGATGSGKSELLRTLVTTLVISHPPDELGLLLADFKGGATFSGLAALPHVAGIVTNLEADLGLVDRFRDALGGELQRRQELLAAAGKVSSLEAYQQVAAQRPDLERLPRLLVIIDEFSEMLAIRPDLAELFATIGRVGRSIGIHLLLATQRLDTGRIRGLEAHLSYRICLRTFSEAESREAMGSPDAHRLPAEPGWAYLRADTAEPIRFRTAIVSRPSRPGRAVRPTEAGHILPFELENVVGQRVAELHRRSSIDTGSPGSPGVWHRPMPSILDVAIERLTAGAPFHPRGHPVRPVWLSPLPARLFLDGLPSAAAATLRPSAPLPESSETSAAGGKRGLRVPLGIVDVPERQRQDQFEWDFEEGNGNLLIVGAGRSGKSTAVHTLLVSLASNHPPGDIAILGVDFGGEGMLAVRDLPHVVAVATRSDPELTRLVLTRVRSALNEREARFRRQRRDPIATLRPARREAPNTSVVPLSDAGAIVLVIDGWAALREADPDADAIVEDIVGRGPGLGVHTVLTITSAGQLRSRLTAGFGGRIELRLADSFDSTIDRQLAKALPADRPGRCLVAGRHYAQLAMPIASGDTDLRETVERIRLRWPGPGVATIDTLPAVVRLTDIQRRNPTGSRQEPGSFVLGVGEHDLSPVRQSLLGADPHLLVFGDTGSGKTALLRSVLMQLRSPTDGGHCGSNSGNHGAVENGDVDDHAVPAVDDGRSGPLRDVGQSRAEIFIVDYRRGLAEQSATQMPSAGSTFLNRPAAVSSACAALVGRLTDRLSPPTQQAVRTPGDPVHHDPACDHPAQEQPAHDRPAHDTAADTSEIYLIVDDYELVTSTAGNPLAALIPFIPHARDIGFHLILARRSGGAARSQYEPLLQSLGDLGTPILLLSGSAAEGRLGHGLLPQPLPPGRAQFARRGAGLQNIQVAWTGPGTPADNVLAG